MFRIYNTKTRLDPNEIGQLMLLLSSGGELASNIKTRVNVIISRNKAKKKRYAQTFFKKLRKKIFPSYLFSEEKLKKPRL